MAQTKPVPRRRVAFGDGHETRQPRLGGQKVITTGVEGGLAHLIADGQQQPIGIEQEVKLHRHRHGPGGRFQRLEPRGPGVGGVILQMAVKAVAHRLGPEQQVGADRIVFQYGDLAGGFHERRRGLDQIGRPLRVPLLQRKSDDG